MDDLIWEFEGKSTLAVLAVTSGEYYMDIHCQVPIVLSSPRVNVL